MGKIEKYIFIMLIYKYIKYIRMTSYINNLDNIIEKTSKLTINDNENENKNENNNENENNNNINDISNINNIDEIYNKDSTRKWIKLISNNL